MLGKRFFCINNHRLAYCVGEAIPPFLGGIDNKQHTHTADAFAFAHSKKVIYEIDYLPRES